MAAKVLTSDILVKFKNIKLSLLKALVLTYNIKADLPIDTFKTLTNTILHTKTTDHSLKDKLLIPITDFKKLDFSQYYTILRA